MDSARTVWVVGGGSGIGRATAIAAAAAGSQVAVSGRRQSALDDTTASIRAQGGTAIAVPLDISDVAATQQAYDEVCSRLDRPTDVVIASGVNSPLRSWSNQTMSEFAQIIDTNLTAVARVIDVVLPAMRQGSSGSIVIVSSYAAWRHAPVAGVAYTASKLGLGALCATLNSQEADAGIRATLICPGDVDTDLLALRPEPPSAEARAGMLAPDDVARAIQFVLSSAPHVRIDELVISPMSQR